MNQVAEEARNSSAKRKNRRLIVLLLGLSAAMFAVGFAMVPLYNLICSVTGINSIATNNSRVSEKELQLGEVSERLVTVQFDVTLNNKLPFAVYPKVKQLQVRPGEPVVTAYMAKNNADYTIVSQAVPGITPWQATEYFHKIECFCFTEQTLLGGEEKEMGIRFIVDSELPEEMTVLTLSYTFMDKDRENANRSQHQHADHQHIDAPGLDKHRVLSGNEKIPRHLADNSIKK
jgi:cytochrome c oxidase assembly protein subunit 11